MSDVRARLDALAPEARAALERALLARRGRTPDDAAIAPREGADAVLSSPQRRLWFFDSLAPGAPTYNAIVAQWLSGPLDPDLLESALAAVVARHEVLRSVILLPPGADEPVQRPLADWEFRVGRHLADGATLEARRDHATELARRLARVPYDLTCDLPIRADLVQVDPEEWLLAIQEHHIAFDGWSDEILFGEVQEHYAASTGHRPPPTRAALPVQYADYATWQQRRLASGALAVHADYWRDALAGSPTVSALPLDRPRPPSQRFEGRHLEVDLRHADAVRELRTRVGATDFMVLVAAWAATLYRWSGETDLVLGTPMANRSRSETEALIGFFSNTVPLRVRVDGSAGFRTLVEQVRDVALGAFDHQDLPFEHIVEAAAPQRTPGVNPLFCVNVRVQSTPPARLDLPGVTGLPVHIDLGFSRFDLAIEMQMDAGHIGGYLEFNQAVFDADTAERLVQRLDQLLGASLADPEAALWSLPQPEGGSRRPARRARTAPADSASVDVHWIDLTRPVDAADLADLDASELRRADAFRFDVHRDRFLRRRAHLRRILSQATGVAGARLEFRTGSHGRPYLVSDAARTRFSTSHSESVAVVALSGHELGVDVEMIRSAPGDRALAERMFAPEESAALAAVGDPGFAEHFYRCWTRKEAYVKATGLGLSLPLDSFAVEVTDTPRPAVLRSESGPDDPVDRTICSLAVPGGGAAAALVVHHRAPVVTVHHAEPAEPPKIPITTNALAQSSGRGGIT